VIFPIICSFSLLRYRPQSRDDLLSRLTVHILLATLVSVGYALLVYGLGLIAGSALPANHPFLIGLLVLLLAVALDPVRAYFQSRVDKYLHRTKSDHQERLLAFSRELPKALDIRSISRLLRTYIMGSLHPERLHIFIYDSMVDLYTATLDLAGEPTTDLRFPPDSDIVATLSDRRAGIMLDNEGPNPLTKSPHSARVALLNAQLFIPMPGQDKLVGWLALGRKRSGESYSRGELAYLAALCDQSALAIERAQVIANLERRVREMDVLTRTARGVNITLEFDDLLELVYAQINSIIPTIDFHITLWGKAREALYHAFYLENDERRPDCENKPIPPNQGLGRQVITSRRAIVTEDYVQTCRSRGILPQMEGVHAWVGVPLNAGAETIGAICLGNRLPATVYSNHQVELLQAIADQAAGAIAKARLLEETEARARQLAILNEIGRNLTSTLETRPLLNLILQSAVEILDCEAGSLLMVDEQSGELVFEVTVGPVADNLHGLRLPPSTGIVGRSVDQGEALIINNVQASSSWYSEADKQTGFVTRDLMVVPMIIKQKVVGVVEVINKRDGAPFYDDDQELLSTFTSQAAVAIENARLYTQTDEALSARVQEMAVMQRIDRELNAGLDLEHVMQITLHWSLRQSGASAGLIGLVVYQDEKIPTTLHILASEGFAQKPGDIPLQLEAGTPVPSRVGRVHNNVLRAITNKQAHQVQKDEISRQAGQAEHDSPEEGFGATILPTAQEQVVIPIQREAETIAILLLESEKSGTFRPETIAFLSRLSDHAAIAIANAQLYSDLQAANIAKSDFVSLVSHELKTPMTSIKGYADLLAQGAVGPINEIQTGFLDTIRSNVNRMATLVSDLADISRIEANRLRLEFSPLPVSELMAEVIRSSQAQIEAKDQQLRLELPDELPPVWGDKVRLIQILSNLVSNANKYTPDNGEITLRAEVAANQWDSQGAPEVVHISVQDTGYGIAAEERRKIFQKFFRSENEKIREAPGTGLGLNITRHLVEMQGGKIWFESELGVGSTFHFTIPVAAVG